MPYIKENGKTFYHHPGDYTLFREHDENFCGPRFKYKRCPFCQKPIAMRINNWHSHIVKCSPEKLFYREISDLRYLPIK